MGECGAHCLGRALLRVPALGSLCVNAGAKMHRLAGVKVRHG